MAATCLAILLLSGCGRGDRPPLGTVSGTVTLDGKPLTGARLIFEPAAGGRASTGLTDDKGRYELIYIRKDKGAKVGAHLVRISIADSDAGNAELLPDRYNSRSVLKAEVKQGHNTVDFPLASK